MAQPEKISDDTAAEERERDPVGDDEDEKPTVTAENDGGGGVRISLPRSRKERRSERRSRPEDDTAAQAQREEMARVRRELDETRSLVLSLRSQPPQAAPAQVDDPYQRTLTDIRQEQESIQAALRSGTFTEPAEIERLRARFYALEDKRDEVRAERLERRLERRIPQRAEGETEEALLKAEFPSVIRNKAAMQLALGIYHQLGAEHQARGEDPNSLELSREALRRAGERFGLLRGAAPPPPSPAQQQRYGAVPAQAGTRSSSREMRLSRDQMRMATSMFPRLPEEDAYAKWAGMYSDWGRKQTEPQE